MRVERSIRFEVVTAEIRARAVAEDHTARFLESAIRINEAAANDTSVRVCAEGAQQCVMPPWQWNGVVVQEHNDLTGCFLRAAVARRDEPLVARVADDTQPPIPALEIIESVLGLDSAAIVHNQHLAGEVITERCVERANAGQ